MVDTLFGGFARHKYQDAHDQIVTRYPEPGVIAGYAPPLPGLDGSAPGPNAKPRPAYYLAQGEWKWWPDPIGDTAFPPDEDLNIRAPPNGWWVMRQKARQIRHFLSRGNTDYQDVLNIEDPHFSPPKYKTLIALPNDPNASKHFWVPQFPGRHKKHVNDVSFLAICDVEAAKAPAGFFEFCATLHPKATSFTDVGFPSPREEEQFREEKIEALKPGMGAALKEQAANLTSKKKTLPEVEYEEGPKHAVVSRPSNEQWAKMNSFRREPVPLNTPVPQPEEDTKKSSSIKSLAKSMVPVDLGGGGSDCDGDDTVIPGKCSPNLIPAKSMRSSRFSAADLNPITSVKNAKDKFVFPTLNRYEMTIAPTPLRPHAPLNIFPAGGVDPNCELNGSVNGISCSMDAAQQELKKEALGNLYGEAEENLRAIHKRNLAFKNTYNTDSVPITTTRRLPISAEPPRDTTDAECASRCRTARCRAVCARDAEWNNFWTQFDQIHGPSVGNYARRKFGFLDPPSDEKAVSWGCRYSRETEDQQSFFDKLLNSTKALSEHTIPAPPPARCNSGHLPDFPLDHHFGDVPGLPEMIHL